VGEVNISVVFISIQSDTCNVWKNSSCLLSLADYSYKLEVVIMIVVIVFGFITAYAISAYHH
jgi:hypothetical protein